MRVKLNLVRVQEKGQVTLPDDVRRRLGIKKGDLVAAMEIFEEVPITPQASKT
jgi:AbrB family looped-hinge helix DNA binding protein